MKRWILCSDLTWAIKRCSQRLVEVLKWNFHVLKIQKQTNYKQFWKLAEFKAQVLEVVDVGESNDSTSNGRDSRSLVWKGTSIRTGGCTSWGKNTFSCNLMRTQGLHTSSSSRAHYIIVCIYCNTYKMLIYKYNYIMQCIYIYIQTVFF